MAKRRNRKNGTDDAETVEAAPEQEAPTVGHNSDTTPELTEDQRIALTFVHKRAYVAALAAKKKADAEFKNVAKLAKSELGPDAVADIKDLIAMETEEGEFAIKASIERQLRVARWMGLPYGAQAGLFDNVDLTPAAEKAYANGKRDGLAGASQNNPHDPSVPQYGEYLRGWQDGQAVISSGIRPLSPVEAAAIADPGGEFDDLPAAEAVH